MAKTKKCNLCGKTKRLNSFHIDKECQNGRKNRFKKCALKKRSEYGQANKTKNHFVAERKCYACKQVKDSSEFAKDRTSPGGISYDCKACRREQRLLKEYGISEEQYLSMLNAQEGRCWICGIHCSEKKLHIDHDHTTGIVRGLLCGNCNRGLGLFTENKQSLEKAIRYLTRFEERKPIA